MTTKEIEEENRLDAFQREMLREKEITADEEIVHKGYSVDEDSDGSGKDARVRNRSGLGAITPPESPNIAPSDMPHTQSDEEHTSVEQVDATADSPELLAQGIYTQREESPLTSESSSDSDPPQVLDEVADPTPPQVLDEVAESTPPPAMLWMGGGNQRESRSRRCRE